MKAGIIIGVFLGVALALADASVLFSNKPLQEDIFSCVGRCNQTGTIPIPGCQCNTRCVQYNDCCADYYTLCLPSSEESCAGRCGNPFNPAQPCQCNTACEEKGDCCNDYVDLCEGSQGPITDAELREFSEEIFALEGENPNNVNQFVTWDLQGRTTSGGTVDNAPLPLMTVEPAAYQTGTVALLVALFDNYDAEVSIRENVTPEESAEDAAFLDAVFATPIFQKLGDFLTSKGVTFNRAKFEEMWFGMYSRSGTVLGSSGLEHVFLGELRSGVSGFHNWAFFAKEEEAGRLNYRGWMEFLDLGTKGGIIQHNFQWRSQNKPISSMFLGTSPEFELAVYSVCWLTRSDVSCPMSFGGARVPVTTWTIGSSKQFVASAYAM